MNISYIYVVFIILRLKSFILLVFSVTLKDNDFFSHLTSQFDWAKLANFSFIFTVFRTFEFSRFRYFDDHFCHELLFSKSLIFSLKISFLDINHRMFIWKVKFCRILFLLFSLSLSYFFSSISRVSYFSHVFYCLWLDSSKIFFCLSKSSWVLNTI